MQASLVKFCHNNWGFPGLINWPTIIPSLKYIEAQIEVRIEARIEGLLDSRILLMMKPAEHEKAQSWQTDLNRA